MSTPIPNGFPPGEDRPGGIKRIVVFGKAVGIKALVVVLGEKVCKALGGWGCKPKGALPPTSIQKRGSPGATLGPSFHLVHRQN